MPAAPLTLTTDHIENTDLIFFFSGGTKRSPHGDPQVDNDDPGNPENPTHHIHLTGPNIACTVFFQ